MADVQRVVGWGIDFVDMDNDGDEDVKVAYGPDLIKGDLGGGLGFENTPEQYLIVSK